MLQASSALPLKSAADGLKASVPLGGTLDIPNGSIRMRTIHDVGSRSLDVQLDPIPNASTPTRGEPGQFLDTGMTGAR